MSLVHVHCARVLIPSPTNHAVASFAGKFDCDCLEYVQRSWPTLPSVVPRDPLKNDSVAMRNDQEQGGPDVIKPAWLQKVEKAFCNF